MIVRYDIQSRLWADGKRNLPNSNPFWRAINTLLRGSAHLSFQVHLRRWLCTSIHVQNIILYTIGTRFVRMEYAPTLQMVPNGKCHRFNRTCTATVSAEYRGRDIAMRTRIDDFADLIQVAAEALGKALADGDAGGKHPPGSWMGETVDNQVEHLVGHIHGLMHGDTSEDHLSHIICRAVMARRSGASAAALNIANNGNARG